MRVSVRSSTIARLAGAVAAVWLSGAGSALAGGGVDAGTLQAVLDDVCSVFGIPQASCQLLGRGSRDPLTPVVLELSALSNEPLDIIRLGDGDCQLATFSASLPLCPQVAVNAVNTPVQFPSGPSDEESSDQSLIALRYLTPLAFKPGGLPTQYTDPAATSFFYAVVLDGKNGQPQVLDVFYDLVGAKLKKGPVATISFPLAVYNKTDGSESTVAATLTLNATCNDDAECLTGTVTLPSTSTKYKAAQFGIQLASHFATSPNSPTPHAIFELLFPILANTKNDPTYFGAAQGTNCR